MSHFARPSHPCFLSLMKLLTGTLAGWDTAVVTALSASQYAVLELRLDLYGKTPAQRRKKNE